jgi:type I restriction enzyme, S subunit
MSKIEELINKLCPDGVEFKSIDEVVKLNSYKQLGAAELEVLRVDDGDIKLLPSSNNNNWYTNKDLAEKYICEGEIFTMGRARNANEKYINGNFVSANNIIIESNDSSFTLTKFIYYFVINNKKDIYVETSTYPKFDINIFKNLKIPVPPMEIQREIVKILDNFTQLTAELTAELTARKQQYEFYRDKLLNFNTSNEDGQSVEWKKLWEVSAWDKRFTGIDRGKQVKVIKYNHLLASDLKSYQQDNGNVKLLTTSITELYTTEALAGDLLSEGEVIAIPSGGNPIIQYYKGKFLTADNRIATSLDLKIIDNKYLYYILQNRIDEISSFYRGSGIKHPEMAKILNLDIPIPIIEKQKEIVEQLDKFSKLCEDISEGLPAEIEARKQQYEFYRDKLLTFKEKAS